MQKKITNIRTKVQFTTTTGVLGRVICANKLRAMNIVKSTFGNVQISILHEYKTDGFLIEDTVLTD